MHKHINDNASGSFAGCSRFHLLPVTFWIVSVFLVLFQVLNLFLHLFLSPFCTNKPGSEAGQGPNKRHAGSWILESFRVLTGKRTHANTDQKGEFLIFFKGS